MTTASASTDPVRLHTARKKGSSATVDIDLDGGRLASLVVDGLSLLVGPDDRATRWGSFPMIPWCGRLPQGRLDFDGERHDFPITSAPHANHGLLHTTDWRLSGQSSSDPDTTETAEPLTDVTIEADLPALWPWGGRATQRFELAPNSLTVTAEVHAGEQAMPAMIGWHPWFRRRLERGGSAKLDAMPESAYAMDTDMIPTGELIPTPRQPWNDCFVDLVLPPVIEWPNALTLSIESSFDHWVLYTAPEHALCVEPQSGPPNQLNSDPQIIEPDESMSGWMRFEWS